MSGVVVLNQLRSEQIDADGNPVVVEDNQTIDSESRALLIAGTDGSQAQIVRVGTDGTLKVDPIGTTAQPITDGGGSITVDGTVAVSNFPATQAVTQSGTWSSRTQDGYGVPLTATTTTPTGTETALVVRVAGIVETTVDGYVTAGQAGPWNVAVSNFPNVQPVSDNGSSLTVDGYVTAGQAGPWNVAVSITASVLGNGTQTSVGASATLVLGSNPNRKLAIIQNVGNQNVRIGAAGVTNTTGMRLTPGAILMLTPPFIPTNSIFAIREGGGSSTVLTQEAT